MKYDLAKKLKDAGFPQRKLTGGWICSELEGQPAIAAPNLDELIEACGEDFGNLEREDEGVEDGGVRWIVSTADNLFHDGVARTPTEAVARLWLALNKK